MRRSPNEVFSRYEVILADGRVQVVWYSHGANDAAVVLDGECVFLSYKAQDGGWTKQDFENAAKLERSEHYAIPQLKQRTDSHH